MDSVVSVVSALPPFELDRHSFILIVFPSPHTKLSIVFSVFSEALPGFEWGYYQFCSCYQCCYCYYCCCLCYYRCYLVLCCCVDPLKITKAFMHARDEFSLQLSYTLARREREREQEREREGRIHCQRLQCGPEESSEQHRGQMESGRCSRTHPPTGRVSS